MRNKKGLIYDVVLCLHCSSLKFFQGVQKTKGYAGVVAGKQRENRVLETGTRVGKTARGISVSHIENRAKKLCFCCQVHCSYTCSFFSPHPNNSFPTEFPNTK